ncbi:hypothetical protein DYB32_002905 [Aphanomyces invadans]|uniref:Uncharacterized protein n=1 Tax=Aphanomyces invadans TaxID=157072 RepID=A0A3R7ACA4_9STRA|nr:hypothetical protein DYB32_002905 [Aphanomyces invadans]
MWPQHQLSSIAPSTKAPPQALRADVLDLIAVLCCLYCFLMCFMHLGLSIFPYMQRFFGFIDPIVTATVFAMCGTLHLRGWWRMRTMRSVVNRTSKHLQDIAPLLITAHSRRQVTSTRGISSDDRIRNLVRLQTSHFNACTDLNVVHDQLQQTKRAYEDQGVRGSAIVAILSAKVSLLAGSANRLSVLVLARPSGFKCRSRWNFACIRYNFGLVRVFRERLVVTIILFDLVLGVVLPLSLAVPVIYNLVSDPSIIHDQAWDVYAISVIKAMLIMTLADLIAAVTPMLLLYVTLQNVHTANIDSFFTRHASLDAASGATDIPVELPQSSPLFRPLAAARIRWRYGVFCLYTIFLNFLTIRNCPMRAPYRPPPHIARFTELYILQLQNCSLDTTAIDTIDFSQYSRMLFLSFSSNSISEIPTSLQRLPPLCLGISLNRNNLYNVTFPDWIVPAWENLTMLYLRAANMTTFPPVLMHLEWIGIIDVTSNAIADFPSLPVSAFAATVVAVPSSPSFV